MLIEYALARLAGLKSRFVTPAAIRRIVEDADLPLTVAILEETVFAEEMKDLTVKTGKEITAGATLRAIENGHWRLRALLAKYAKLAFPEKYDVVLARWDMEEIKAAVRYLNSGGDVLERRFSFTSFILEPEKKKIWNPHYKVADFLALLSGAGHPLAPGFGHELAEKDPVQFEINLERYYFTRFLPGRIGMDRPLGEFYRRRLDILNVKAALLMRNTETDPERARQTHIEGGGAVRLREFNAIRTAPLDSTAPILEKRMGARRGLDPLITPRRLADGLEKAAHDRFRITNISCPGGMLAFALFAESMDFMTADLKMAIRFSFARAPFTEAEVLFRGGF